MHYAEASSMIDRTQRSSHRFSRRLKDSEGGMISVPADFANVCARPLIKLEKVDFWDSEVCGNVWI
jgi:alkyl hydroperoxide reductase subunit AhpC